MENKNINWNEQFKVRLAQSIPEMDLHDIVKLLVVRKLIHLHKPQKNRIKVYTEYPLDGNVCDVFFENIKKGERVAYEVQGDTSKKWVEEKDKKYSIDWIIIDLKKCPENIHEINKWVEQHIV